MQREEFSKEQNNFFIFTCKNDYYSRDRNGIVWVVKFRFVIRYAKYEKRVKAFAVRFPPKNSRVVSRGATARLEVSVRHFYGAVATYAYRGAD